MDNRRSGGKLEADLRSVLHFFGDFQEIPSICFIKRWARCGSFQHGFVKGKHVSFLIDSRTPRRGFIDRARKSARKSNHGFVVAARSDALEVMQGNFGKTINADGHRSASHTN
jgi:hypothetical protein